MKVIKKGNIYRKANFFERNKFEIYLLGSVIVGFFCFVLAVLIRG